jgi:hypothetical protein
MSSNNNLITFSTCWYILKSKFDIKTYLSWITNLLSIVSNFNLVIFTDHKSFKTLINSIDFTNKNIKIIFKPFHCFYTYKYKDFWIQNHKKSKLFLHSHIDWQLNMLWNEKVFFINETIQNKYFDTLYYGWCDIGYFRNRSIDLHTHFLNKWPNNNKLLNEPFSKNYIHYGCVQNNIFTYSSLQNDIKTHYLNKSENQPTYQMEELCFAGGFFLLKRELIDTYMKLYDEKLTYYFTHNFTIKDDQTIIMDLIFTNPNLFCSHTEDDSNFENWFMFQRLLL